MKTMIKIAIAMLAVTSIKASGFTAVDIEEIRAGMPAAVQALAPGEQDDYLAKCDIRGSRPGTSPEDVAASVEHYRKLTELDFAYWEACFKKMGNDFFGTLDQEGKSGYIAPQIEEEFKNHPTQLALYDFVVSHVYAVRTHGLEAKLKEIGYKNNPPKEGEEGFDTYPDHLRGLTPTVQEIRESSQQPYKALEKLKEDVRSGSDISAHAITILNDLAPSAQALAEFLAINL